MFVTCFSVNNFMSDVYIDCISSCDQFLFPLQTLSYSTEPRFYETLDHGFPSSTATSRVDPSR